MTNHSAITVPFHDNTLFVVNHNGEPYVPMRPVVEGMKMDWASQYTKMKTRFNTCVVKITMQLPGDTQCRDVICLALRKLAGWLNTISPNKVKPEIRDKVIQYQNECDDVLYEYWTTGEVKRELPLTPQPSQTEKDAYFINALANHFDIIYEAWRKQLAPTLRKVESPLIATLSDRFTDGIVLLRMLQKKLNDKLTPCESARIM